MKFGILALTAFLGLVSLIVSFYCASLSDWVASAVSVPTPPDAWLWASDEEASALSVPTPPDAWLGVSDEEVICTKAGYSCSSDCSYVQLCVQTGDDSYDGYNVESCDPGKTSCDGSTHKCASDAGSCPGAVEDFTCNTLGMFPDPYNCSVFHVCAASGGADSPQACPSPYAFNALNGACDTRICSSQPVPKCSKLGQTGTVGGNPAIYYVCIPGTSGGIRPELYRCPHGRYTGAGICSSP
uniref:Chitin-binding type-2 domain-containing protein n=1 Tax=Timema douglasi TaxID=61478 RepID=A0A7R8VTM7_TIMDO|nr:unnamed protein product [Timema douglasi]